MKYRFYFFFIFFTLIALFYPGDSQLFNNFAYNRSIFARIETVPPKINIKPFPYLRYQYAPYTSAESVYITDLDSYTPILDKNAHTQMFPASTVKIITALVVFDIYKPDQVIQIKIPLEEGQVMGLFSGEKITVENLLYGLLIHSGNDAAAALADEIGKEKFVDLMNQKAQQLQMKDSIFKDPAGLNDYSQFISAYDLTLAARALLNNHYLAKMTSLKEIMISDVDYRYFHKLTNVNKLLGEIQGLGGLKTGYTENAGENLVSFYKHNGHQYIIVVLKSLDRFQDTKNIVKWIINNVNYQSVAL